MDAERRGCCGDLDAERRGCCGDLDPERRGRLGDLDAERRSRLGDLDGGRLGRRGDLTGEYLRWRGDAGGARLLALGEEGLLSFRLLPDLLLRCCGDGLAATLFSPPAVSTFSLASFACLLCCDRLLERDDPELDPEVDEPEDEERLPLAELPEPEALLLLEPLPLEDLQQWGKGRCVFTKITGSAYTELVALTNNRLPAFVTAHQNVSLPQPFQTLPMLHFHNTPNVNLGRMLPVDTLKSARQQAHTLV